jgi:septal ring factor EnvC (AmiA/AmiB activator)
MASIKFTVNGPELVEDTSLETQLEQACKEVERLNAELRQNREDRKRMEQQIEEVAEHRCKALMAKKHQELEGERSLMKAVEHRYYSGLAGLLKQMALAEKMIENFHAESPNYANHPVLGKFLRELKAVFTSMGTAKAFVTEEDMRRAWKEVQAEQDAKKD